MEGKRGGIRGEGVPGPFLGGTPRENFGVGAPGGLPGGSTLGGLHLNSNLGVYLGVNIGVNLGI